MKLTYIIAPAIVLLLIAGVVSANHSWGKYHWDISTAESEASPLVLGDNLSSLWRSSLAGASADWNNSVLKSAVVSGNNSLCNPVLGQVEVCNDAYGENGWLGIAQIWAYRGKDGHIAQALVKVNDTYFSLPQYDSAAWRNSVMCQEVGHTFGLDHQDENFSNANLGTCMDYTSDPAGTNGNANNEHPNQHDFEMMEQIYAHLNGTSGGGDGPGNGNGKGNGKGNGNKPADVGANIDLNNPSSWGEVVSRDAQGNPSLYRRNLGSGQELITHVLWVE